MRLIWLGVLIVMCSQAQSQLEEAVTLARQGRYAEARKALDGVAEPASLRQKIALHRLKAAIASGLKEPGPAAEEMHLALELAPNEPQLLLGTAVAELQAGQLDQALEHARRAGDDAAANAIRGDIQERRGAFLEAVQAYERAVEVEPGREEYRVALGSELIRHQSFRNATKQLEGAAGAFPGSAKIRTLIGIAQYADGEPGDAIKWLQDALRRDASFEPAHVCLAMIVLQSSAAPSPEVTGTLCEWNRLVCAAVKIRIARERGDGALQQSAIKTLQQGPEDSSVARCELGRAYEWAGKLDQARVEMESCVHLEPSPQNRYRLALLYKKLGQNDLARRQLQLRDHALREMAEQTARGLDVLRASGLAEK